MSFAKKVGVAEIYQGKSFTKSIGKEDKTGVVIPWEANDIGDFEVYNSAGVSVASGSLVKSVDNLTLTFTLGSTDTSALLGEHLLIANLKNTIDTEVDITIAQYEITFLEKKAG